MHELKAICVVSFFSSLGVTVATDSAVHGYENVEQESLKKAQNTLWGKEHTVQGHLRYDGLVHWCRLNRFDSLVRIHTVFAKNNLH